MIFYLELFVAGHALLRVLRAGSTLDPPVCTRIFQLNWNYSHPQEVNDSCTWYFCSMQNVKQPWHAGEVLMSSTAVMKSPDESQTDQNRATRGAA